MARRRTVDTGEPLSSAPLLEEGTQPATERHWREAAWRLRDRLLTSDRFRHWAEVFWPTRWVARRRAAQLFDLLAGFVYSQVLLVCVRLRLLEHLARHGPQTLPSLARHMDLPLAAADRLVQAAVALRLLQARSAGRYGLGELGAPMVGNPGLVALVEHHEALYRDLADPLALLRGTDHAQGSDGFNGSGPNRQLAHFWPYAGAPSPGQLDDRSVAAYSALMAATQPLVAEQVLAACSLRSHRQLLDVGGGEGVFACAAAQCTPGLRVQVFDLPSVAARAEARFAQTGLSDRCQAHGGDFLRDELPRGADVASLIRVVHDHDDDAALALLAAVRRALPRGGRLLLAEPLAATPGAEAMGDAYFGFYLLAMGQGRARTAERLVQMLGRCGFGEVARCRTRMPLLTGVLVATAVDGGHDKSSVNIS